MRPESFINSNVSSIGTRSSERRRTLSSLPSSLILQIVYDVLPYPGEMDMNEYRRLMARTLYWMATYLRFTNRGLYLGTVFLEFVL